MISAKRIFVPSSENLAQGLLTKHTISPRILALGLTHPRRIYCMRYPELIARVTTEQTLASEELPFTWRRILRGCKSLLMVVPQLAPL